MDPKNIISAFENAGYKCRPYSGRGMYGQECVGVLVPRGTSLFVVGLDVAHLLADVNVRSLRPATDTLGRDEILYFTLCPWPTDVSSDEDEDEDE